MSPWRRMRQWWPETAGWSIARSLSGFLPMVRTLPVRGSSLMTADSNLRMILGIGSLLHSGDHDGGVVHSAARVGQVHEVFGDHLGRLHLADGLEDPAVRD